MKKAMFTLAVAAIAVLASCSSSRPSANAQMTDTELQAAIENQFQQDMTLRNASLDVDADADDNEATISGTVPTEGDRDRAIELAKNANPGLDVTDKIEVSEASQQVPLTDYTKDMADQARMKAKTAGEKIGNSVEDAWIHSKIVAGLMTNSKTPERKINVDVVDNVVTLRGTVDSQQAKDQAEQVAKSTDGVKQVKNMLTVSAV